LDAKKTGEASPLFFIPYNFKTVTQLLDCFAMTTIKAVEKQLKKCYNYQKSQYYDSLE